MEKDNVIKALREIADLLEITEASRFEYMAFRNAAAGIDDWSGDLAAIVAEGQTTELPNVGKGIAKVINELVTDDQSTELDRVRALVPDQLPLLLRFRGLGPKRVRTLWQELNIESPSDLEKEIQKGSVQELKGFGAKTVEKMQESIEYFRNNAPYRKPKPQLDHVPVARKSDGTIFAGTSGYSYPAWKGTFYPAKAKTNDLLEHYANRLNTVEINNTFYRFPSETVVQQWKTHTNDSFQFALKAHRRVTHQMRLSEGTKIRIQEFVDRCSVLGSRLGCILFQLPPDFEKDDERLGNLLNAIPDGPRYAVEFRHKSWNDDSVDRMLADRNVARVAGDSETDAPQQFVTADFLYVRLRKPAYEQDELDMWSDWIAKHSAEKRDVLLFLKHDDTGDIPNEIVRRWGS